MRRQGASFSSALAAIGVGGERQAKLQVGSDAISDQMVEIRRVRFAMAVRVSGVRVRPEEQVVLHIDAELVTAATARIVAREPAG